MKRDALLVFVATVVLHAACRDGDSLELPDGDEAIPKIPVSGETSTGTGGTTSSGTGGGGTGGTPTGGAGGQPSCDTSGEVVLNELLPNPTGADGGNEWVELYNKGAGSVDISGWQLEAGTSSYAVKFTLPASTTIAAQTYVVIGGPNVSTADYISAANLGMGNATSNSGRFPFPCKRSQSHPHAAHRTHCT